MPKFSHIRLLKCKDGRYRKGIIVTFSEEEKNIGPYHIGDHYCDGPQRNTVHTAFDTAVIQLLHGGHCDRFSTVEYGDDTPPFRASFTIATMTITKSSPGILIDACIKYSITMK